jgi:hypothetical protein
VRVRLLLRIREERDGSRGRRTRPRRIFQLLLRARGRSLSDRTGSEFCAAELCSRRRVLGRDSFAGEFGAGRGPCLPP